MDRGTAQAERKASNQLEQNFCFVLNEEICKRNKKQS